MTAALRFAVVGATLVVLAGDFDVDADGAFVVVAGDSDAGAVVVVAGAFVVVAVDSDVDDSGVDAGGAFVVEVAGVVVAVSLGSAEATGASENDVKTRVRAMNINPSAVHRDTTPSPARRRKERLRMGYTFRYTHKFSIDLPEAADLAHGILRSALPHSSGLPEDRERLATTPGRRHQSARKFGCRRCDRRAVFGPRVTRPQGLPFDPFH
ncbi:hypothetical protein [Rhodococcus sp. W8901]|uniref:hypothetical protein n=1 Tax=Rhodococcus sp. W8901 TaxID=2742603 RepID=UPI0020C72C90|nr:hypothetical protein [Rhodococcus sp. W8901]